jgi:CxxC-x17-CxxC domain-containing protein
MGYTILFCAFIAERKKALGVCRCFDSCICSMEGSTPMSFTDKALTCRDCAAEFCFSAAEQEFFSAKGLVNEPKRCPNCRVLFRLKKEGKDPSSAMKVDCADCGVATVVPFKPKGLRPVYCGACLTNHPRIPAADTRELVTA